MNENHSTSFSDKAMNASRDMNIGMRSSGGLDYDPVIGRAAVDRALSWVGHARYGTNAECGPTVFDCSGFVAYAITGIYERNGSTWQMYNCSPGFGYTAITNPQPGDICVIETNNKHHCSIYLGSGQMIHCADDGAVVSYIANEPYVYRRYTGSSS